MSKMYGTPVTKQEADEMFSNWIDLKVKSYNDLSALYDTDPVMRRFYCGEPESLKGTQDLGFLFDKESILQILDSLNEDDAEGILICNGVKIEDSENTGKPTLIIYPYKFRTKGDHDSLVSVSTNKATEHPYTMFSKSVLTSVPDEIDPSDIRP